MWRNSINLVLKKGGTKEGGGGEGGGRGGGGELKKINLFIKNYIL